jgi:nanoRNase/pAp phosphatase (c-di-AMP/oligoRNAs hydrolase)
MTLGGGGHPGAGGCHMSGDLVGTKEKVVRALEQAFNRTSQPVIKTSQPPKSPDTASS